MKKKLIYSSVLFFTLSIGYALPRQHNINNFILNGIIKGASDSTKVILANEKLDIVGYAKPVNGKFKIEGSFTNNGAFYFLFIDKIDPKQKYVPLFLDNSNVVVVGSIEDWPNVTVRGSSSNSDFELVYAQEKKLNSPGSDANKANDSLFSFMKKLVDTKHNSTYVPYLLITTKRFSISEIENAYANLTLYAKKSRYGKELPDYIAALKKADSIAIGKVAPDLLYPSPEGEIVSLKDVVSKSKLTMVDFWASWCLPCRKETPNIRKIYEQFHEKGLNIVSVSLDTKPGDWKDAIAKDNMPWFHMSDLKGWNSDAATAFKVIKVPQCYLIDDKGVIIAENLMGVELHKKVSEYFSK